MQKKKKIAQMIHCLDNLNDKVNNTKIKHKGKQNNTRLPEDKLNTHIHTHTKATT